jgi:hypothetical protein
MANRSDCHASWGVPFSFDVRINAIAFFSAGIGVLVGYLPARSAARPDTSAST